MGSRWWVREKVRGTKLALECRAIGMHFSRAHECTFLHSSVHFARPHPLVALEILSSRSYCIMVMLAYH